MQERNKKNMVRNKLVLPGNKGGPYAESRPCMRPTEDENILKFRLREALSGERKNYIKHVPPTHVVPSNHIQHFERIICHCIIYPFYNKHEKTSEVFHPLVNTFTACEVNLI
jgi:hypothetical protein